MNSKTTSPRTNTGDIPKSIEARIAHLEFKFNAIDKAFIRADEMMTEIKGIAKEAKNASSMNA